MPVHSIQAVNGNDYIHDHTSYAAGNLLFETRPLTLAEAVRTLEAQHCDRQFERDQLSDGD